MSEQKVVCLGSLKKILNEFPEILVRGKSIAGFIRYNALPPYFQDRQKKDRTVASDHSGIAVDEKGLILVLQLVDQRTNDPEAVQKLLKLPDSLVLGILIREEGQSGAQALVKKLTIELEPFRNVVMKLYSDDTGRATLFYDEIPELRELNYTNENWWLADRLHDRLHHFRTIARVELNILQVRLDRGFEHPIYCFADGSLKKSKFDSERIYLLDEEKLRQWLPNLPKEDGALEPLLYKKDSSKAFFDAKFNVRQFSRSMAILFALFGTPATFVEAVKEKQ